MLLIVKHILILERLKGEKVCYLVDEYSDIYHLVKLLLSLAQNYNPI